MTLMFRIEPQDADSEPQPIMKATRVQVPLSGARPSGRNVAERPPKTLSPIAASTMVACLSMR